MGFERSIESAVRGYVVERRIGAEIEARWLRWDAADAAALLEVAAALALGRNQLADFMEWLEDIAGRDGVPAAAILGAPEMRGILATSLGRSDKLKRVKARLRALRYPRLAALEQSLEDDVRALGLGPDVTVRFPPGLEGDEITVEVRARRPDALREAVGRLARAVEAGGFDGLWSRLAGS